MASWKYDPNRKWTTDPDLGLLESVAQRGEPTDAAVLRFPGYGDLEAAVARFTTGIEKSEDRSAIHEAGHAVVGHLAGFTTVSVNLVDSEESENAGFVHSDLLVVDGPEPMTEKFKRLQSVLLMNVSGYVAEELAFGPSLQVEMWEAGEILEAELPITPDQREEMVLGAESVARQLLQDNWGAVEAIATAVIAGRSVSGDVVVEAICGK